MHKVVLSSQLSPVPQSPVAYVTVLHLVAYHYSYLRTLPYSQKVHADRGRLNCANVFEAYFARSPSEFYFAPLETQPTKSSNPIVGGIGLRTGCGNENGPGVCSAVRRFLFSPLSQSHPQSRLRRPYSLSSLPPSPLRTTLRLSHLSACPFSSSTRKCSWISSSSRWY